MRALAIVLALSVAFVAAILVREWLAWRREWRKQAKAWQEFS